MDAWLSLEVIEAVAAAMLLIFSAVLGNRSAKEGLFQEAISYFTEAIELYPFDHR